jgi:hypothetical protein
MLTDFQEQCCSSMKSVGMDMVHSSCFKEMSQNEAEVLNK